MMGLLATAGVGVSLTPTLASPDSGRRKTGVIVSVVGALLGALYFIKGMDTYGGIVNAEYLAQPYLKKVSIFAHRMKILIGVLAALAFAAWDTWLLLIL